MKNYGLSLEFCGNSWTYLIEIPPLSPQKGWLKTNKIIYTHTVKNKILLGHCGSPVYDGKGGK